MWKERSRAFGSTHETTLKVCKKRERLEACTPAHLVYRLIVEDPAEVLDHVVGRRERLRAHLHRHPHLLPGAETRP